MRKLLLALALFLTPSLAMAQCNGVFPASNVCGTTSSGPNIPGPLPLSSFALSPGGSSGQIQTNNGSGGLAGISLSQDCTATSSGVTTCTKLQNVAVTSTGATTNDVMYYNGSGWLHNAVTSVINAVCTVSPTPCVQLFGYYSAIWYGADPTGAASSTVAINNAIAAACAGGVKSVVYIPNGSYMVNGGINATRISGGCKIKGNHDTSTVLFTTTGTNAVLDLTGSSDVVIENLELNSASASVQFGVLAAQSNFATDCNVLVFRRVFVNGTYAKASVYDYGCTEVSWYDSGMVNLAGGSIPTAVEYITGTNDLAGASGYTTIAVGTLQSGGWDHFNVQIHDQTAGAGFSGVIPLYIHNPGAPVTFYGGIIAGSVGSSTGGMVTFGSGTNTGATFSGVNFYADNGTQSGYLFYNNGQVDGLNVTGCTTLYSSAMLGQVAGTSWRHLHILGNGVVPALAFATQQSGTTGTITSSIVDAQGQNINMGAGGAITHTVMINPGTLTAGTQTANGSF